MKHSARNDRIFSTASWILVVGLLVAMSLLWVNPPSGMGPVAQLIGVQGSQIFYTALYGTEAVVLGYAKLFRKKRLRKAALLAIYLTAMFTMILTFVIVGISWGIIDNVLLAIISGACFLYWKFKTEYLNPEDFEEELQQIRRES